MKKEDARTLSGQVQEEKRKQATRLRERGKSYKEIADIVGVNFETDRILSTNTPQCGYSVFAVYYYR